MRLPFELLLLSLAHLTATAPVQPRAANFRSLRGLTSLEHDFSNLDTVSRPDKFFHEATFDSHYDGRFAEEELPYEHRAFHLRLLVKSYLETMDRIGIRTWLMHGCLLGWWWNRRIMPWDSDVDVMVDERSMKQLGSWWNMTVHHFSATDLGLVGYKKEEGKKYLLEVNPHYTNTSTKDEYNVIDARWIDTSTGLYIDITTVHVAPVPSSDSPAVEEDDLELYTKDQHLYSHSQIFPLRKTMFEDVAVKIPYAYEELLHEEYGPEALTDTWYNGYGFDPDKREWVMAEPTDQQVMQLMERAKHTVAGRTSWREKKDKKGKKGDGKSKVMKFASEEEWLADMDPGSGGGPQGKRYKLSKGLPGG